MTVPRHRSSSSASASPQPAKRLKASSAEAEKADPTPYFASDLLSDHQAHLYKTSYEQSEPFKHVVVEKLFQNDLLTKVKDECLSELSFTEKETDIYKVHQTGDLASLSFLTESQIARLSNLLILRDALYSSTFRSFIAKVTGCGPLSGTKTDMSVNTYRKGCHLLNHDDVIGSRRVSYILYMPLPQFQGWQKDWGGALELYPVKLGPSGVNEPESFPTKSIPPCWNQFVFFEVQPGKSFHSVQEVIVGEGEDGRERLSISGWFHAAQEGEEGYMPEQSDPEAKSSLEQLTASSTTFHDYQDLGEALLPSAPLSEEHTSFLSEYLNPVYLQQKNLQAMTARFVEESSLELHSFLCEPLAQKLESDLRERDAEDGLGKSRHGRIPSHTAGIGAGWCVKGPPHKARYCVLSPLLTSHANHTTPYAMGLSSDDIMRNIQEKLFPSAAFRAWLAHVSSFLPIRYTAEARRFRPGLDYTLATSEDGEARLDVVLGLTPASEVQSNGKGKGKAKVNEDETGWESGQWGGWECYMAPHDGDEDPAVYRSGPIKELKPEKRVNEEGNAESDNDVANLDGSHDNEDADQSMVDDATLLTVQPGFNRLLLVLRDEGVMHFVKYVSSSADGSRWDVSGEYEIGMVEEDVDVEEVVDEDN